MNARLRILHLEDNPADSELIHETLAMAQISRETIRVETESEFVSALEQGGFDLILADYTLPSFDGLSALKIAQRQCPDVPFIFVSGTLGEDVAIESLKIGATDYILKTRLSRLVPSVERALREAEARTELRRTEETLREQASLLSLTHDAIYVGDLKGVVQYWNRSAEVLYGWPEADAIGKVAHELLKTVFPLSFEQIEAELFRTSRWEGELVKTRRDGAQLVVASRWSLKRDDAGEPIAILVTSNDITERKRAEVALRRLNRELQAISNCNQTLLRATDEQSLIDEICRIICHEAGYRMAWVGYAQDDDKKSVRPVAWSGMEDGYLEIADIRWSEDHERGRGQGGIAIRSGKTYYVQDVTTDACVAPWRESALKRGYRSIISLPLKDEDRKIFGVLTIYSSEPNAFSPDEIRLLEELAGDLAFGICVIRARAERDQAEETLALRSFALNSVHEAAFLIDEDARFRYVNEEACRALGYSREELRGMCVQDVDPDFRMERWSDHWAAVKSNHSLTFESRHRAKDGRVFPVELNSNYFEYGGKAYILGLARDISERKQAEEATLEARVSERTRIARELHDTLLQSFHGLLLRFKGVSLLLPNRPIEAKDTLDSAIKRAAEAIAEGRDAVQGLRESTVQSNDLAQAIRSLGEELANGTTNQPPVGFLVSVEGEPRNLHPIVRDEIYKISAEAMRNAFRHADAKQVAVGVHYEDEQIRLRVRDDGKGIDPEVLSAKAAEGHYGIPGMRERAASMGGKLELWSELGGGTEVELRVPASKAYATAERSSGSSRTSSRTSGVA